MIISDKKKNERLKDWQNTGGVLILGYNLLRTMANPKARTKKSIKDEYISCLLNPGQYHCQVYIFKS